MEDPDRSDDIADFDPTKDPDIEEEAFDIDFQTDENLETLPVDMPENSIQLYLQDIKQDALLDESQEFRLGLAIQANEFMSVFETQEDGVDFQALFEDMQSTWQQVLNDCRQLGVTPPALNEIVGEAAQLHADVLLQGPSVTRSFLGDPRWGQDKHWDQLARDLFRFATDAYLMPLSSSKKISLSCCNESKLQNNHEQNTWLPSREEARQTIAEITKNAEIAQHKLAESNLRLVISVAKKYNYRGTSMMDLIQEGNIGLLKAIQKYDPARGFRFSTYATWWIRQSISRYLNENGRTIRIPVHMVELISKLIKVQHNLVQSLGRDPTFEEMAVQSGFLSDEDVKTIMELGDSKKISDPGLLHRLDEATHKVEQILKSAQEPVSLESPVGDEDNSTLADYIEDVDAEEPIAEAMRSNLRDTVKKSLGNLNERERAILSLRFGLEDGINHSLEDISARYGLTRERIRQLEAAALRKLRDPRHTNPLRDFYRED